MFCATIPAVGAKLNADQLRKPEEERKPISRITSLAVGFLVIAAVMYHTLRWQN